MLATNAVIFKSDAPGTDGIANYLELILRENVISRINKGDRARSASLTKSARRSDIGGETTQPLPRLSPHEIIASIMRAGVNPGEMRGLDMCTAHW